jgi:tetratricopeptide (TPR) repeat protein
MGASEIHGPEEETHEEAVATAEEEHVEDPYDHWELGPSHERGEEAGSTPDAEALSDFIYTEPELEEAIQNLARSSTAGDVFETYEELKTGLENQLSTEDAGTHFNLGKEYLEMELYKEAAREFKIALKDPALEVDCYINLAHCALAEANHEEAIIYFLKVLKGFDGPEDERRGFLYDLATAYEASGQETEAESIYRSIYEVDPRFRNVAYKIKRASARERAIPLEDTMLEVELL